MSLFLKRTAHHDGQRLWPLFIAYGAATPNAIVAASSTHHGRLPLRSVSSESTGGGGGLVDAADGAGCEAVDSDMMAML